MLISDLVHRAREADPRARLVWISARRDGGALYRAQGDGWELWSPDDLARTIAARRGVAVHQSRRPGPPGFLDRITSVLGVAGLLDLPLTQTVAGGENPPVGSLSLLDAWIARHRLDFAADLGLGEHAVVVDELGVLPRPAPGTPGCTVVTPAALPETLGPAAPL